MLSDYKMRLNLIKGYPSGQGVLPSLDGLCSRSSGYKSIVSGRGVTIFLDHPPARARSAGRAACAKGAAWMATGRPTFIAALRHDRITAPFVLEGPMTGEMFQGLHTDDALAIRLTARRGVSPPSHRLDTTPTKIAPSTALPRHAWGTKKKASSHRCRPPSLLWVSPIDAGHQVTELRTRSSPRHPPATAKESAEFSICSVSVCSEPLRSVLCHATHEQWARGPHQPPTRYLNSQSVVAHRSGQSHCCRLSAQHTFKNAPPHALLRLASPCCRAFMLGV
jgi:hypothetical protein